MTAPRAHAPIRTLTWVCEACAGYVERRRLRKGELSPHGQQRVLYCTGRCKRPTTHKAMVGEVRG
jgi:hypothetical protein